MTAGFFWFLGLTPTVTLALLKDLEEKATVQHNEMSSSYPSICDILTSTDDNPQDVPVSPKSDCELSRCVLNLQFLFSKSFLEPKKHFKPSFVDRLNSLLFTV